MDRDRGHAEDAHPLDPVLMFGADAVFQARLGCRVSAPGRIEPRLGQGLFEDCRSGERGFPFVMGATKGEVETVVMLLDFRCYFRRGRSI